MIQNAFTVDLEEWYQGLTSTNPKIERWPALESRVVYATRLLTDILEQHQVKATFFVLGAVADEHPGLIEEIVAAGHEIGIHGYYHKFVYKLTPDEFRRELEMSIAAVERITGERPIGHRAPYFSVNGSTPWAFSYMRAQGLLYDSSVFPTRNMLYGFPGAPRFPYRVKEEEAGIVEFPASTARLGSKTLPIAGGFYVRALPYAVIRRAIKQINDAGHAAIMYIHPWELDTGQRYSAVTPRERLTHYHGRRSLSTKLHRMLSEFQFTTLAWLHENTYSTPPVFADTSASISPSDSHVRVMEDRCAEEPPAVADMAAGR